MLSGIGSSTTSSPSSPVTNQVPFEKAAFMDFSSSIRVCRSNGWFLLISSDMVSGEIKHFVNGVILVENVNIDLREIFL